jgi:hypothetical protein
MYILNYVFEGPAGYFCIKRRPQNRWRVKANGEVLAGLFASPQDAIGTLRQHHEVPADLEQWTKEFEPPSEVSVLRCP